MIPHSRPTIEDPDRRAVDQALGLGRVGPGPIAAELAATVGASLGGRRTRLLRSGTDALTEALARLELRPGARVAIPVLSCESLLDACSRRGLEPWLCPVRDDLTIDPDRIGPVDAVIAPHAWGTAVDSAALDALGVPWVEDCATSPACVTAAGPAGTAGTTAVFSFGPTKYVTGALGGAIVWREAFAEVGPGDPHELPDLNAALALSQWSRLSAFVARRRAIAAIYDQAIPAALGVPRLARPEDTYYRYIVRTRRPAEPIADRLRARGIGASPSVNPWLDERLGVRRHELQTPWRGHLLSLPIYPSMTDVELSRVIDELHAL
ncbi:MAG: DegT/DnrJ/EryC1/StrS aminotransferase family protein [Myxococcales bacterium]|nr:DegT/DnrJ/EryC1/StrS aminotransferase family protein [Myxococcales bacterium]MCB9530414.1 DegT/DnrJ/EryC1/StrS aminotransferase family protein [Myxococcales bacterium]MCB9533661.1 DegT/DnrJ/EryC1/StrS aminotransferase family protein [Myxococcales bacterium]